MLFCVSSFAATTGVTSATTKTLSSRHRAATLISLQNGERSNNNRNRRGRRCFSVRNENDDSPKVYVPCGAFGGASSPERKAADIMHQLLTYTATWVVIGQLESINCRLNVQTPDGESKEQNLDGQGEVNRVNNQHEFLLDFLEKNPIRNPEEWMSKLSKADQSLANRIMIARQGHGFRVEERRNAREERHRERK